MAVWHKFLRYIGQVLILYLLLKYLPDLRNKINLSEIGLVILTVLIISILCDVSCCLAFDSSDTDDSVDNGQVPTSQCQCSGRVEGFEDKVETKLETKPETKPETKSEPEPVVEVKANIAVVEDNVDGVAEDAKVVKAEKTFVPVQGYYGEVIKEAQRDMATSRQEDGVMVDELKFTDFNHLPLASGYKSKNYEYGYSFLPPEKWYPEPPRPPVCVTEKRCPVCPSLSTNGVADMKEWDSSRRITGPDLIDTEYVSQKLNAGR
ncbi:MAG: hypothetical protein CMF62_02945 [Magnetococcales bacterium]|nr:hypothetical protein [Magnetococcales bacterium]